MKSPRNAIPSFLVKLYDILESEKYKHVVHWNDNGRSFHVENYHLFSDEILPLYFKHRNFSSFVRQLNMYDFHKVRNNKSEMNFYHCKFIKGKRHLLKYIKRKQKMLNNNNTNVYNNNNSSSNISLCMYIKDIERTILTLQNDVKQCFNKINELSLMLSQYIHNKDNDTQNYYMNNHNMKLPSPFFDEHALLDNTTVDDTYFNFDNI